METVVVAKVPVGIDYSLSSFDRLLVASSSGCAFPWSLGS